MPENTILYDYFRHLLNGSHTEEGVELLLDDFQVYKRTENSYQYASLHSITGCRNDIRQKYYFDGILRHADGTETVVDKIGIISLSIGNLGDADTHSGPETSTCAEDIHLETINSSLYNCYYRLRNPHKSYRNIWESFLWLADFLKHLSDYLTWAALNEKPIGLIQLQDEFIRTLKTWHCQDLKFTAWHDLSGNTTDFRRYLTSANHIEFLFKMMDRISDNKQDLIDHPLWREVGRTDVRSLDLTKISEAHTLVTQHAADCFLESFPSWGPSKQDLLRVQKPSTEVAQKQGHRRRQLRLGFKHTHSQASHFKDHDDARYSSAELLLEKASLQPQVVSLATLDVTGKAAVVRIHSDDCFSRRCNCSPRYEFALITSAHGQGFSVRWLVLPDRTICAGLNVQKRSGGITPHYPIGNELFLTDECCCASVSSHDIVAVYRISVDQDHASDDDDLFVQRLWRSERNAVSTLDDASLNCCPQHRASYETHRPRTLENLQANESLSSLDAFSGCGLLGDGFCCGSDGLFQTTRAIDCMKYATLSMRANRTGSDQCEIINDDVNVEFKKICLGRLPYPMYYCIKAGCPCQGFSRRNANKISKGAQKNCSMLAHTLSIIELLIPPMVLIENVLGMDETSPSAVGQAVSTLVSLGYQVEVFQLKASDYGAATRRERIFIAATAPGIPLPNLPRPTHGPDLSSLKTTSAATMNLEKVTNDTLLNYRNPDHVPGERLDPLVLRIVHKISGSTTRAGGKMDSFMDCYSRLNELEKDWVRNLTKEQQAKGSGTLRRAHPDKPSATLTTGCSVMDSRSTGSLHWLDDRTLTIEELRRFQGIPPWFIIIGSKSRQIEQIGNSVEWTVAMLLGKMFAEAWRLRTRNFAMTEPRTVGIEDLSDFEEESRHSIRITTETRREIVERQRVSVTFPTAVDTLSRRMRKSLSLDATDTDFAFVLPELFPSNTRKPATKLSRKRYRVSVSRGEGDEDEYDLPGINTLLTPSKPRSISTLPKQPSTNASGYGDGDGDDDDDDQHLTPLDVLLTPSRPRNIPRSQKSVFTGIKVPPRRPAYPTETQQPSPKSSPMPMTNNEAEEDDDDESPSKRLKRLGNTSISTDTSTARTSSRDRLERLRSRYGFETPKKTQKWTDGHGADGSSPLTPITLDDSE